MDTKVKLRKWGSSLGIIVPSEVVKEENLKEGDDVFVKIKKNPLKETFGILKDWKTDTQKLKDGIRKGWE